MDGLLVNVQRALAHGFRHGRMAVDRFGELLDGALELDGKCCLFDELRRTRGKNVDTEDLAVFLTGKDLIMPSVWPATRLRPLPLVGNLPTL